MIKVITTVGTSLFENFLKQNNTIRNQYETIKDKSFSEWKNYNSEIESIKNNIKLFLQNPDASAETKSLLKIKEKYNNNDLEIICICTDTILSKLSAEILKENESNFVGIKISIIKVIEGLSINNKENFENLGLGKLVDFLNETFRKIDEKKSDEYLFNITGGYKAIIPYITIVGQLFDMDIYYIFETTEELIRIPQLPLQFDTSVAEKYYYTLDLLKNNLNSNPNYLLSKEISKELQNFGFINVENNKQKITGLGHFFMLIIEKKMLSAKSILGFIVEMKLLEYFYRNPEPGYPFVEQSNETLNVNGIKVKGGEIDLLLKQKEDDSLNNSIIIEVKSEFAFNSVNFDNVKLQFESKINLIKQNNFIPKEYRFYLHTSDLSVFNASPISNSFKENILQIKKLSSETNFRFYLILADLKLKKNQNPYSDFLQNKLEMGKNIKEIKFS